MKKTRRTLLGSLLAVVCALGVLFFASTPLRSLNAEGTEAKTCADITFGTTEYTATGALGTGSFSTTNFTVTSVSGSSFYCPKDNASNSSRYSAKIGTTTNGGNLTFNFPAVKITQVKVLAYLYSTDSSKTATCSVSTSANTTAQSKIVTLTSAPDITSASTEPGLVFTNLDNGGNTSTSLVIASDSTARFNLCKIVLTLGSSSPVVSSSSVSSYSSAVGGTPLNVYAIEQTGKYGDCTLFKYGNYEALFDFGNTGSQAQLAEALSTYVTDHVLDLVVLTHPHTDHYGGVYGGTTSAGNGGTLIDGGITSVTKIIDNGADGYSAASYATYWTNGVRSYWVGKGAVYTPIASVVSGHMYDATWTLSGPLSVQWLDTSNYPTVGGAGPTDANEGSVACDMKFGTYDFIMCGDLPSTPEETLVTNYTGHAFIDSGDTVIYKACHHCSSTSNSANFLAFLKPTYGFTESGIDDGNATSSGVVSNQHPYADARTRIETYTGADHLWWVGTCGTLMMTIPSDCSSFTIHGAGRKYGTYYYNGLVVDPDSEKDTPLESTKWASTGH